MTEVFCCSSGTTIHWRVIVCDFEQKREREFNYYLEEKMVKAKAEFRELLKETKIITYK